MRGTNPCDGYAIGHLPEDVQVSGAKDGLTVLYKA